MNVNPLRDASGDRWGAGRRLWIVLPVLAFVTLSLPGPRDVDRGLTRLAHPPRPADGEAAWEPLRMHSLPEAGLVPVADGQSPDTVLAGGTVADGRSGLRSLRMGDPGLPTLVGPPPVRRAGEGRDEPAGLLDSVGDEDRSRVEFSRRGWLADRVQALEPAMPGPAPGGMPGPLSAWESVLFGGDDPFTGLSAGASPFFRLDAPDLDRTDDWFMRSAPAEEDFGGPPADIRSLFDR